MTRLFVLLLSFVLSVSPSLAVSNLVNPVPSKSTGQKLAATEWNACIDTLYNGLNNSIIPAINALQVSTSTPEIGAQAIFNARLSLQSGVPFTTTDITTNNLYLNACKGGNLVGTLDPATLKWTARKLTAPLTLTVPTAVRDLFDIYVYWDSSGGTLALESSGYVTATATNSPTSGATKVINIPSTTGFAVGDTISITDGSNQEEATITAISTNVSVTVDLLSAGYTLPVLRSNTPSVPLTTIDGTPVKSTDVSRRYVATVLVVNNQVTDSLGSRGIGNFYNREPRVIRSRNTATTISVPQNAISLSNATKAIGTERILIVTPPLATPLMVARMENALTGSNSVYMFEKIDNQTQYVVAAPATTGITSQTPYTIPAGTSGGRHVIDDYWDNQSATNAATVTNVAGGYQLSNTLGWALN